jgi:ribonuclease HII
VIDSALHDHDRARGVRLIAGVDEVGRASWAGPIMAAGVLFDLERLSSGAGRSLLNELDDSKRLGRTKRERLAQAIFRHAEAVSLVSISASQIDRIKIDPANVACLERALRAVGERAELRLVDGDLALGARAPEHELVVHGDATSATIAAASIVAKVARDRLMARLGDRYPGYGFETNAGYRSPKHVDALEKLGPSAVHRQSFNVRCLGGSVAPAPARRPKPRSAPWRELPAQEKAAHLLEKITIADRAWTDEPRRPRETRSAFIRRVLLGETEPIEAP